MASLLLRTPTLSPQNPASSTGFSSRYICLEWSLLPLILWPFQNCIQPRRSTWNRKENNVETVSPRRKRLLGQKSANSVYFEKYLREMCVFDLYLLCLLLRFGHGEEDAVEQYCGHHNVIKILVCRYKNTTSPQAVPRWKYKKGVCGGEAVDVVLPKSLGHNAESL